MKILEDNNEQQHLQQDMDVALLLADIRRIEIRDGTGGVV